MKTRAEAWYAVRTEPGSQKPQREYLVETTRSRKGYRIVPSLDPNVSAVERALSDAGMTYYMPSEKRLVRDRRKPDLWKTRRFALMVGYIFVRDPADMGRLLAVPGVSGIVANAYGDPLKIDLLEILKIRSAEGDAEKEFDEDVRAARRQLRKRAKKNPALAKLVDELDIAGTITVPLDSEVLAA